MSDSEFRFGEGKISGTISVFLGLLCIAAVLCFHFPEYLTTAELRAKYSVDFMRILLRIAMFCAVAFGALTFFLSKGKRLGFAGIFLTMIAQLLGGATVDVGDFNSSAISFGLDWLVLDLLSSTLIFIFLEKLIPHYRNQKILREDWVHDLTFFGFNHLLISYVLLIVNKFSGTLFGWALSPSIQGTIQGMPFLVQFVVILFAADLMQYWSHRAMHEVPALWKIHSVHHSPAAMDWLSGSRLHIFELLATRCLVFLPIFLLGFSPSVINLYVIFVGFQAVFNHANIEFNPPIFRDIFVTPHFHHWHHSADADAIDMNYAAHIPIMDQIFGTYLGNHDKWPVTYGVVGKTLPKGIFLQHLYPFRSEVVNMEQNAAKKIS